MKTLFAIVTAVVVLAFGASAALAETGCGFDRDRTASKSEGTVYYPPAETS